jgi:hypothetical protein
MGDIKDCSMQNRKVDQFIEVIDLDSDELGEFDALAVCNCIEPIEKAPDWGFKVEVALSAIYRQDSPEAIAKRFDVSVDDVYRWSEELVDAGKLDAAGGPRPVNLRDEVVQRNGTLLSATR